MTAILLTSIGVGLVLVGFGLNSLKILAANSRIYQALNAAGSGLAAAGAVMIRFYPFIVLNALWGLVALVSLARNLIGHDHHLHFRVRHRDLTSQHA